MFYSKSLKICALIIYCRDTLDFVLMDVFLVCDNVSLLSDSSEGMFAQIKNIAE